MGSVLVSRCSRLWVYPYSGTLNNNKNEAVDVSKDWMGKRCGDRLHAEH